MKYGFENLKKFIDIACEIEVIVAKVAADGAVNAQDIGVLLGEAPALVMMVPAAVTAAPMLKFEILDLDNEEAAQIVAYTMGKLQCSNEKAIKIVEKSIKLAFDAYVDVKELVEAIRWEAPVA